MLTELEKWHGWLLTYQHDRIKLPSEQQELRYHGDAGTRGHGDMARRRRARSATTLEGIGADPPSLSDDDENVMMMLINHISSDDDDMMMTIDLPSDDDITAMMKTIEHIDEDIVHSGTDCPSTIQVMLAGPEDDQLQAAQQREFSPGPFIDTNVVVKIFSWFPGGGHNTVLESTLRYIEETANHGHTRATQQEHGTTTIHLLTSARAT